MNRCDCSLICILVSLYFCLAQIEIVDDEPLKAVIKTLGGWPVATPDWDPAGDSVPSLETLISILKRNFTLGVLLEEWVGPDDRHSQSNVMQVRKFQQAIGSMCI